MYLLRVAIIVINKMVKWLNKMGHKAWSAFFGGGPSMTMEADDPDDNEAEMTQEAQPDTGPAQEFVPEGNDPKHVKEFVMARDMDGQVAALKNMSSNEHRTWTRDLDAKQRGIIMGAGVDQIAAHLSGTFPIQGLPVFGKVDTLRLSDLKPVATTGTPKAAMGAGTGVTFSAPLPKKSPEIQVSGIKQEGPMFGGSNVIYPEFGKKAGSENLRKRRAEHRKNQDARAEAKADKKKNDQQMVLKFIPSMPGMQGRQPLGYRF
jgi:hypothetical protein